MVRAEKGRWSVEVTESTGSLSLTQVLGHLERQLVKRLEGLLAPEGVTVDQWRIMDLLSDGVGRPMSTIAAHIAVPGATLTKRADRLVDAALVYRHAGEADRRRVLVHLAEHGWEVHSRLQPAVAATETDLLRPIGAEAVSLIDMLSRMARPTLPELITARST
jgi:DNA-binding MarR family transcriptional regulator